MNPAKVKEELGKRFEINSDDLEKCKKGPDINTRMSTAKPFLDMLSSMQSGQAKPTDASLRRAAEAAVKVALQCAGNDKVKAKVDYYMTT